MMYAALAGFALGLMAWDFGRRWLVSYERGVEAALIRESEIRGEMLDKHGDLATTVNLRVRELSDRIAVLPSLSYVDALRASHDKLSVDVAELYERPTETPDVAKLNAAVLNLGKQLVELSAHVTDEFKKVRTAQAGMVGSGRRTFGS